MCYSARLFGDRASGAKIKTPKPEHIDAWRNLTGDLQALCRIFDDKRHPYYEHRLAA